MGIYTHSSTRATEPASHISTQHRANFARDAVFAEFGTRNARALDQGDFEDRQPDHGPRPLGQITAKVTHDTGMKSLRHWLAQAGRADTDDEREAAIKTASEIARLAGLKVDLPGRRVA